jgi:hypothetical protein
VLKSGHKLIVLGDLKSSSQTMKAKVLYKHMAGGTEETHEKSQAQQSKFWPRAEPRISQIQNRSVNYSIVVFKTKTGK